MVLSFFLGLTQLRHSASQRHVFACGSMVRADLFVCGFSALRAEKPHTIKMARTMLPQAKTPRCDAGCSNYVSPDILDRDSTLVRARLRRLLDIVVLIRHQEQRLGR